MNCLHQINRSTLFIVLAVLAMVPFARADWLQIPDQVVNSDTLIVEVFIESTVTSVQDLQFDLAWDTTVFTYTDGNYVADELIEGWLMEDNILEDGYLRFGALSWEQTIEPGDSGLLVSFTFDVIPDACIPMETHLFDLFNLNGGIATFTGYDSLATCDDPGSTPTPTSTVIPTETPNAPTPTACPNEIWIQDQFVSHGDQIVVDVMISNSMSDIQAWLIYLTFDPEMFSFTSNCDSGDLDPGWTMFDCNEQTPGQIAVAAFCGNGIVPAGSEGTLARLYFTVTCDSCPEGYQSSIEVEESFDDLQFFCSTPGMMTYQQCINSGDVNMDGSITAQDALLAFQYTIGMIDLTYSETCAADCNSSGTVTAGDSQSIFRTVIGLGQCEEPLPRQLRKAPAEVALNQDSTHVQLIKKVDLKKNLLYCDISISENQNPISAFTIDLKAEPGSLQILSCQTGTLAPDWIEFDGVQLSTARTLNKKSQSLESSTHEKDVFRVAGFCLDPILDNNSGTIAQLVFKFQDKNIDPDLEILALYDDLNKVKN